MAFFPRELYGSNAGGFTPLFRLLDDFDSYSKQSNNQHHRSHRNHIPTFQPKFDVREVDNAYELHGELPGMDKKDVHIEFTDPQTLVIRGRIERTYQSGTAPAGLVEDTKMSGAITEGSEGSTTPPPTKKGRPASVHDEGEEDFTEVSAETPATTEVAKSQKSEAPKKPVDKAKYWVSERSIGEFSRTFSFPGRVNQDGVSAKLEEGILTVVVPKAPKHESRRIDIV